MPEDQRHDLYVRYYARVVRYLVKKFGFSLEEARDLAQDVFVSVFMSMEQRSITAIWPFLKTTAHHRAVNEFRSRGIHRRTEGGSADGIPNLSETVMNDIWTGESSPSPETEASRNEQTSQLREAIEQLPPGLRSCVLLRCNDFSYEQIAAALQITPNAVKTRLRDAKKLLMTRIGTGVG
jgi:RNA polymerase sigma-70 factor (ECF subfamily)